MVRVIQAGTEWPSTACGVALTVCAISFGAACSSEPISPVALKGGQEDSAGVPADRGVELGFEAEPTECPELPEVAKVQTGRLALNLALEVAGAPFALGEITTDGLGGTYKLSFLAYYLTNFWLIDAQKRAHAAVLLDADDAPLKYGLRLVNVDDPSTQHLRLAVAPGRYRGLSFSVGVPAACNALDLQTRGYPLTIETEMNWGWTQLNLRLEGSHSSVDGNSGLEYHIGLPQDFRTAQVAAELDARGVSAERTLAFQVDKVLGVGLTTSSMPYADIVDSLASPGTFVLR